jgi:phage shock protein PspC (stress-responsive transcriptional regulator)
MKETIKINLNQRLFDLDTDAYERLKSYLDSLRKYFDKNPDEAEEILQDIEQRIAEILEEKIKGGKLVIGLADIDEIISLMGTIDDFVRDNNPSDEDTGEEGNENRKSRADDYSRDNRRLYRDIDNNIIGGVCSGISAFFNIDAVWIRLAFVLFCFANGIGLLIYLILWAIVPAARTTAQRLQMKGRPVTVENIQDSVKLEYERVKDNFNKYSKSESFKRSRDTAYEILNTLGQIALVMIKVVLILLGVGLVIALLAFLLGFFGVVAVGWDFHEWKLPNIPLREHIGPVFHNITFFSIALMLVILIPVVSILAGIVKLIFGIRTGYGILSAFAWTIWALALVYVIISLISGKNLDLHSYKEKDEVILEVNNAKSLYVNLDRKTFSGWEIGYFTFLNHEIIRNKITDQYYLKPRFSILPSEDTLMRIVIEKTATIPPFRKHFYKNCQYYWSQQDTLLILDNYFNFDEDEIWQLPGINICLFVPEGRTLVLDRRIEELIKDSYQEDFPLFQYNTLLTMKNGKLLKNEVLSK